MKAKILLMRILLVLLIAVDDAALTSTNTVKFRVADGANFGAVATQLVTIDATAPTQTITIDRITDDNEIIGDFRTSDKNGLIIHATMTEVLGVWVQMSGEF
jgi:hypothetical protein